MNEIPRFDEFFGIRWNFSIGELLVVFVVLTLLWYLARKNLIARFWLWPVLGIFVLMSLIFIGVELSAVGIQQGYRPEQPIAFSHRIHVKQNEISCAYCHFTAEKSKHAGIPPLNLCLGCHVRIQTGSPEVQKVYDALSKAEKGEGKAFEWEKVHNLPDFTYFNHSQHVQVGGTVILGRPVEGPEDVQEVCQTCHGNVENMDVIEQVAPLSMGWCIDCHDTTPSPQNPQKTVAQMGGNNCARCHY